MTASPTEQELLACPFCGGEGEMSWYARGSDSACAGYFVECTTCSASGQGLDIQGEMPDRDDYTKSLAVAAWNTRTPPSDRDLRERVKSALDVMTEPGVRSLDDITDAIIAALSTQPPEPKESDRAG